MATYLRQLLSTAFARWAPRTDLWGGVFGALVPCGYVLAGKPVPDNVATLIAEIAVGTAGGLIALRLLIAPYIIWKADQEMIADLKRQLDDPERQRRERILAAQETARFEFAREVARYTDGMKASFMTINFTQEVLDTLESQAVLFNYDDNFESFWRRFTEALFSSKSVTMIPLDKPDPDGFIEVQINRNLNYYINSYRILGRAIVSFLTYQQTDWTGALRKLNELYLEYEQQGRVEFDDESSLDAALARRSPSLPPSRTTPGSCPD